MDNPILAPCLPASRFLLFPLDRRGRECYFCNILLLLQHSMKRDGHRNLSRRERQIMDILYQRGRASAAEIHAAMPDAPTYSAVRAKLRVLEEKGHIRHEEESLHYVYLPTVARFLFVPDVPLF